MKKRIIYITNYDRKRLEELVENRLFQEIDREKQKLLNLLVGRLSRSEIVLWKEINSNIVTMNSMVRLKTLDDNEKTEYSLVFPEAANLRRNKISILSYLGISLLGRKVNDVIKIRASGGIQRAVINSILYQPEANVRCN